MIGPKRYAFAEVLLIVGFAVMLGIGIARIWQPQPEPSHKGTVTCFLPPEVGRASIALTCSWQEGVPVVGSQVQQPTQPYRLGPSTYVDMLMQDCLPVSTTGSVPERIQLSCFPPAALELRRPR